MPRSISFRRHQRERKMRRAQEVITQVWRQSWRSANKYADNLCKCSCQMCQPSEPLGRQAKRANEVAAWEINQLVKEN